MTIHRVLLLIDACCLLGAWTAALVLGGGTVAPVAVALGATAAGLAQLMAVRLHRARGCTLRSVELSGLVRVAAASACGAWVTAAVLRGRLRSPIALTGAAVTLVLLAIVRSVIAGWFAGRRARGVGLRNVLLVGTNAEAQDLAVLLGSQPELGYRIVGTVGYQPVPGGPLDGLRWMGSSDHAVEAATEVGATGLVLAVTALDRPDLQRLISEALESQLHVHLSSGVGMIAHHRLRRSPVGHDPWFYIEPHTSGGIRDVTKRGMDLLFASLNLILASPILLIAAVAIKLEDGGPVFFRQVRVGRHDRQFDCLKLRTMVIDAEQRQGDLASVNGRGGPLFKATNDPRITRVGRLLRASSLDELPQLFNIIKGEMSLVGPRPALPTEVARFDAQHRERCRVRPGLTGLWQVEARDNPNFDAYRRLDLFYVENHSLSLDLAILAITIPKVVSRAWRAALRARSRRRAQATDIETLTPNAEQALEAS